MTSPSETKPADQPRESQLILLIDDDVMITEGLAAGLEREERTVITCNDVESAELIVEHMHPSHIVADIRLSGPFGYEGLDFIRYAKRHAPDSRIILISGEAAEALQLEASERGAVAFLKKPFEVTELDATLDLLRSAAASARHGENLIIEGIEDEATATMAAHLGIPLGQGFFFGKPADVSAFVQGA